MKSYFKKTVLAFAGVVFANFITMSAFAQTTYINHAQTAGFGTSLNPALSLLSSEGEAAFVTRLQWVGFDGAPKTFWGGAHIGLDRLGATTGLQLRQDRMGVQRLTEASLFFAKEIRLSSQDYMGLSLSAGLLHFDAKYSTIDPMDPAFGQDITESDMLLGAGLVFYRPEVYYAGVSVPRFTGGGLGLFTDKDYVDFQNQYQFTAAYLLPLGEDFHLRPSVVVAHAKNVDTYFNASALVYLQRTVGLGLQVQNEGNLAGMLKLNYAGFGLGYSYQFSTANKALNRRINNSTHEIGVNYNFGRATKLL